MEAVKAPPVTQSWEAKLAELKLSRGGAELLVVKTPKGPLVFGAPSKPVWHRWVATANSDTKDKAEGMRLLALGSLVHPAEAEASAIFDAYPALPAKLADELAKLAGGGDDFEVKVL